MAAASKTKAKAVYGDFQTPFTLATQICELLAQHSLQPAVILEPSCGFGDLLVAAHVGASVGHRRRHPRDQHRAPTTWRYLTEHGAQLDKRASCIYRGQPRFAAFRVGAYTLPLGRSLSLDFMNNSIFALSAPTLENRSCWMTPAALSPARQKLKTTCLHACWTRVRRRSSWVC